MKKLICLLPALALTACGTTGGSPINLGPVGDGLNFLGMSIVLAALVVVIGALIMRGGGK
jgi:hypothetical protein